jgi:hypothetical protein
MHGVTTIKIKEGVTTLDVPHLYLWNIIFSQHNPERKNSSLPSRKDFKNTGVLIDWIKVGFPTGQIATNSHLNSLIVVESANSKLSLYF